MDETQPTHALTIVIIVVSTFQIILAEGRDITSFKKVNLFATQQSYATESIGQSGLAANAVQHKAGNLKNSGHIPSIHLVQTMVHRKSLSNMEQIHISILSKKATAYNSKYRPTSPTTISSLDHAFEEGKAVTNNSNGHGTMWINGFQSNAPKDISGAWYHLESNINNNIQPNKVSEDLVEGKTDDLHPNDTNPGRSPGVGHHFQNENKGAKTAEQTHF